MSGTIYTLGTSTRSLAEFVALLEGHHIEAVGDVRRFPSSRFEHFQGQAFCGRLRQAGFGYVYLDDELGGYRKGGYPEYMETEGFERGVARLEELACSSKLAIVCAERLPWRCHRRFIGRAMAERGWRVVHIIDERHVWQPRGPALASVAD